MESIRPARAEDRAAIALILATTAEFSPIDVKVALELLDCYLEDAVGSGYLISVYDVAGAVAGYVCFGPTPLTEGVWDMYWIAVGNEFRKRGIGRKLVGHTESCISIRKGRMLLIETSSTPPYLAARGLYENTGYRLAATVNDFYMLGDAKLIYQKYL